MRKTIGLALLVLLPAAGVVALAAGGGGEVPLPFYLSPGGASGGFTDPNKARQDSMKDLAEALGKKKSIRSVGTPDEAVILLEVLDRGVREDSGNYSKMFGGKNEVKMVRVRLTVKGGDFSTELTGESAGGGMKGGPGRGAWTKAAYKVADQVDKWVLENDAKLRGIKPATTPGQPAATPSPSAPPQ